MALISFTAKPVIKISQPFFCSMVFLHHHRNLINDLSGDFRLIAPDYPGFGQSSSPSPSDYTYSFDNFALTISHLIDALELSVLYLVRFLKLLQIFSKPIKITREPVFHITGHRYFMILPGINYKLRWHTQTS